MNSFFQNHGVLFALLCAGVGILYGVIMTFRLLKLSDGTERMQEIAGAIQQGAAAYLRRQYTAIAIVGVIIAILLAVSGGIGLGVYAAVGFLIGAITVGCNRLHRHERLGACERAYC